MNNTKTIGKKYLRGLLSLVFLLGLFSTGHAAPVSVAPMENYCVVPPFISQNVAPLVMFIMGRDHKMYYEAYNDASDLNDDGELDITYDHSVEYYGYFDSKKCYKYDATGTPRFAPVGLVDSDGFCRAGSGYWNGNFMNWMSMSRIDVMKKVLYGGFRRRDDQSTTYLERAYIPEDAHSWGKEYTGRLCSNGSTYTNQCVSNEDCKTGFSCVDRSTSLTPLAAPVSPSFCDADPTPKICAQTGTDCSTDSSVCTGAPGDECVYTNTNDMLVVRYSSSATNALDHSELVSSYEPANLLNYFTVTNFSDAALDPNGDHGNNYNIFVVADFEVAAADAGDWHFAVDGDDAVEIEIDGVVVAGWYGLHDDCGGLFTCDINQESTAVSLSEGWHRLVVRHFEYTGQDGVKAYYKKNAADPYTEFGQGPGLNVRAPQPGGTDPTCPLKDVDFIKTGSLRYGPLALGGSAVRHLFCNTTLSVGGMPIMRYVENRTERIWDWASKERPVCNSPNTAGYPFGLVAPTDLEVRVEVCVPGLLEDNCREYPQSPPTKPAGLMQKYGEGHDKVCSMSLKPCQTSKDCSLYQEVCTDSGQMYFGLMTGSYTKNLSGGVVRWNIDSIDHDVDNSQVGIINDKGLLRTLNNLQFTGFDYAGYTHNANCGWSVATEKGRTIQDGECRMWGNPIAEMMYEATRYFAGLKVPTEAFAKGTAALKTDDDDLKLPNQSDPSEPSYEWIVPYLKYPRCAKPFMLVLSDINPSFDSDQLPGNYPFLKHDGTGSTALSFSDPKMLTNLNVTTEADLIGSKEGLNGASIFLGEIGTTFDSQCTAKTVSTLGKSRGICPEEPTKQGSYYSAAVAHYAKTEFGANYKSPVGDPLPDITTYSVAFASPVPKIKISNGTDEMTLVPTGNSVSGCKNLDTNCYGNCTFNYDGATGRGLTLTGCSSKAYCPANQIVDFYVEEIAPDRGRFRINFEDVEIGGDHDMDAIVMYEYCVGSACTPSVASNRVKVTLTSSYASGCIDQALGFVISGSTADGAYLPVRDIDAPFSGNPVVKTMLTKWERTFIFSGAPSAKLIENPLWYASKWGGFVDSDLPGTTGYKVPDKVDEWDEDRDGNPDTYFFVSNPLKLEEQLEKSFLDILRRASSGTAVSVLASGEERGANMLQAVFYPMRLYGKEGGEQNDILWTGRMQNLWFYLDPVLGSSNIREDTVRDSVLDLDEDYVTTLYFDPTENKTRAARYQDTDADGDGDVPKPTIDFENLSNLWEVGEKLFLRDAGEHNTEPGARVILTNFGAGTPDDGTLDAFDKSSLGVTDTMTGMSLQEILQTGSNVEAGKLIDWIRGVREAEEPFCSDSGNSCETDSDCPGGETCIDFRNRAATLAVCSTTTDKFCTRDIDCPAGESCTGERTGTWKLGDIVSSTPRIVSKAPSNDYYNKYNDQTYKLYTETDNANRPDINYKGRGMVFVGANDGMLHAIKLGTQERISDYWDKTRIEKIIGTDLGKEVWAFIPKNVLPYLKYMARKDYCHIYSVDATPYIVDASIGNGAPGYENQDKTIDSWRTILIGSMRLGGGCKVPSPATDCKADDCVNTPSTKVGFSSYFALDVTDTLAHPDDPITYPPKLLWEFTSRSAGGNAGFSTTGPVVVKIAPKDINGDAQKKKNGRWFAVISSGPTGPIDPMTHEFKGRSNQTMKIFVLDLAGRGNGNYWLTRTIDSKIPDSFGNTSFNSVADVDQRNNSKENYSDDVIYLGYVKTATSGNNVDWIDGGILRLPTKEETDPSKWPLPSTLIDGVGPITSTPIKFAEDLGLKERFWVLFGSGRYFYKADDRNGRRSIYAVIEPCYNTKVPFDFDPTCTDEVKRTDLKHATGQSIDYNTAYNTLSYKGWLIDLDCSYDDHTPGCVEGPSPYSAERIITHPLPVARGKKALTYFTSFAPTGDLCGYSGITYLWAVDILTGGAPDESLLFGKALIQVSTGEIKEINLKDAFVEKTVDVKTPEGTTEERGRRSHGFRGVPPQGQGLSVIVMPEGLREIIHMEER